MLIVFTGHGKGKTTAALGQAVRALGWGRRVLMIQFIKSNYVCGEYQFLKTFKIPNSRFQIIPVGLGFVRILGDKLPVSLHRKAAQKGLSLAKRMALNKKWDLIILDEINVAVSLKLLKAIDVIKIIKSSPVDFILTGRNAPKAFIKMADIVTEMKEIKYQRQDDKTPIAQKGIEY